MTAEAGGVGGGLWVAYMYPTGFLLNVGSRSRRSCGWWGRKGVGGGGEWDLQQRHGRLYKDNKTTSRAWQVFITLTDFDNRWGVKARGSEIKYIYIYIYVTYMAGGGGQEV